MGYEKIVTLAERCARYTKTCGKRSILETKPVVKFDVSKLGVCLSDGTIHFQSEKAALNYAKNACMKTANLPPSQQFEIVVTREGSVILGIANGTRTNCDVPNIDIFSFKNRKLLRKNPKPKTVSIEHYHPDCYGRGKTNPLSIGENFGDTAVFEGYNLKSITAYNSLGQYNKIEALPNFNEKLLHEFVQKHKDLITTMVVSEEKAERVSLLKSIEKISEETGFIMSEKNERELRKLRSEIGRLFNRYQETPEYARVTHNFLLENAEKYGMKYTTDMIF